MNILVTGGAGFIGYHTCKRLLEEKHSVSIIDNLETGTIDNISSLLSYDNLQFYQHSILEDQKSLEFIFKKNSPEVVFHFAAHINVRGSVNDPIKDAQTNIIGSLNILELCKKHEVKKIIFSSSGGTVYGSADIYPTPEWNTHDNPHCPYGLSKLTIEKYLDYYSSSCGLKHAVLRYANVYGPNQTEKSEAGVISIFIRQMLKKENPKIYGDGYKTRDYIYIDDVIEANIKIMSYDGYPVNTFNIGTGLETNVNKIFDKVNNLFENKFKREYVEEPKGEIRRSCLETDLANNYLSWDSNTNLDNGIKKTYDWFKNESVKIV